MILKLNSKQDFREVLLRSFFFLLFISLILGLSIEKISIAFKFKSAEPIITMQIKPSTGFPVWASFICGPQLVRIDVETLKRGIKPNGKDKPTNITTGNYVRATNTDSLASGDWTDAKGPWPCFVFEPRNELSFKIGEVDQVILTAFANETVQFPSPNALLFGIFDAERNLSTVQPFAGPTPSINTFTFTRSERTDVKNEYHSYFSVNQQNIVKQDSGFGNNTIAARFLYSPDSYLVISYKEKMPYTPYDLISAVGGLITYALAIWFILFGRGKYRSWGLVQRYLLRTSPDANKKDNRLFSIPYEKTDDLESQMNNNNNNTPPVEISIPAIENSTSDHNFSSPTYYFSTSGTPTQANFASSPPPNSVITSPSQPQLAKDLDKRIDAKVNQKLWFVEQTLSRHYLSGFRLRRYDFDSKKMGLESSYKEEDEEMLTPPNAHHNWNDFDSGIRTPDQNSLGNFQISLPTFQNSNLGNDSLNPEAKRHQYPNVAMGQVPIEKKQRGRNSDFGIVSSAHDGNYLSSSSTSPK